jgi:MATE family multidrug resistance protein
LFHHGLLLCTVLGVALFILTVLSKQIMYLMQTKEVADMAAPYIDWVAFSLIPVIMYQGYKQFADGLAKTKYSMYFVMWCMFFLITCLYMEFGYFQN